MEKTLIKVASRTLAERAKVSLSEATKIVELFCEYYKFCTPLWFELEGVSVWDVWEETLKRYGIE